MMMNITVYHKFLLCSYCVITQRRHKVQQLYGWALAH